jgi:vancomycin resistance protein YoaR
VLAAAAAACALVLVGLAGLSVYAGSSHELAAGTTVAGVDVGGLTTGAAVSRLEGLYGRVSARPVTFTAGGKSFRYAADQLAVRPDWGRAVAQASRAGSGFGPLRGFRRLRARLFGVDVSPRLAVSKGALAYALDGIERSVNSESRSAALVRRGLRVEVVPGQEGRRLVRAAAAGVIVSALGSLDRSSLPTALPVRVSAPPVTAAKLVGPARRATIALSAPVILRGPARSYRISPHRIATLLDLPRNGASKLALSGAAADRYFRALSARVGQPAVDATFQTSGDAVSVVPARDGVELNVPATAQAMLRAALRPTNRVATVIVARAVPAVTTADAKAMGIDTRMAGYKTFYSGTADRVTNLRLGVEALDGTLVPPGGTFSLNKAIGERTAARGFRPAPVIVGTDYTEEVGGGTSQVATTVFNAAWEAGLRITERNPHSLYISRYPLGRDATVYWPSLDLKFQNDTKSWVLVRGLAESDGIHVVIYGGERRRVESSAAPLVVTGPVPKKIVKDPTLPKGERVVDQEGSAPTRTSATRKIYAPDGTLVHTETWTTSYEGETRVVRIGTKAPGTKTQPGKTGAAKKKAAVPDGTATSAPTTTSAPPPATAP